MRKKKYDNAVVGISAAASAIDKLISSNVLLELPCAGPAASQDTAQTAAAAAAPSGGGEYFFGFCVHA